MLKIKKRMLCVFALLLCLFAVSSARVYVVAADEEYAEAAAKQSTRKVEICALRGEIYDRFGEPLTDRYYTYKTVILPSVKGIAALPSLFSGEELSAAEEKLKSGSAIVLDGEYDEVENGVVTVRVPIRYDGTLTHLIGYTDSTGHGVTGIESGFDNLLYIKGGYGISYSVDRRGIILEGDGYSLDGESKVSVTLTIDRTVQRIAERAMLTVEKGAAVVVNAENGEIVAMVSKPNYDTGNIAAELQKDTSPLINRALCPYNVGSVFKPCLAAAAIEYGTDNLICECNGHTTVEGRDFKCNSTVGHGKVDLKTALAKSCNCYFYELGLKLGAEKVYETARSFRFGDGFDLGGGIISREGSLTSLESLQKSNSAIANLSIGQGDLMLTPIGLSVLYSAIANGGSYQLPTVVKGYTDANGVYYENEPSVLNEAIPTATANILKEALKTVLTEGTGEAAYTKGITAGGKTGTAQTGWMDGERRILNGWFCGFAELESGTYTVIVLKEDVKSGSADCAPIFKSITSEMVNLGY